MSGNLPNAYSTKKSLRGVVNAGAATQRASRERIELTILMPCLNEAKTIGICIQKAKNFIADAGIEGEILIADNGSVDGSIDIAQAMGAHVIHVPQQGYGAALIGGINAARGEFIIMGDADDSYDFEALGPFVEKLRSGADVVMGNRFAGGIAPGAMPVLHYYVGNPLLSLAGRIFFRLPVRDFHCGLRGFRAEAIRNLDLRTTGMEFASEMVVRAGLARLRISEVPTSLKPDGRNRAPHLRTWRDGWRHLKFLLMLSPRWLFLLPGLFLSIAGLLMAFLLAPGPLKLTASITLDVNSFIAASVMTVIGHQMVCFSLIARYYASITGMLPDDLNTRTLLVLCKTDRLLIVALCTFIVGVGIFLSAVALWGNVSFGNLPDSSATRLAVAGLSIILIALQTAFSAFLFGIFDIPARRNN